MSTHKENEQIIRTRFNLLLLTLTRVLKFRMYDSTQLFKVQMTKESSLSLHLYKSLQITYRGEAVVRAADCDIARTPSYCKAWKN